MFGDLDWPLNAWRGLSAIAEFLVTDRLESTADSCHEEDRLVNGCGTRDAIAALCVLYEVNLKYNNKVCFLC